MDELDIRDHLRYEREGITIRLLDKCIMDISPSIILGRNEIAFIISEIIAWRPIRAAIINEKGRGT